MAFGSSPWSAASDGSAAWTVQLTELLDNRTNPNGSGISLGHPIGTTGCILTVKALYELECVGERYALAYPGGEPAPHWGRRRHRHGLTAKGDDLDRPPPTPRQLNPTRSAPWRQSVAQRLLRTA